LIFFDCWSALWGFNHEQQSCAGKSKGKEKGKKGHDDSDRFSASQSACGKQKSSKAKKNQTISFSPSFLPSFVLSYPFSLFSKLPPSPPPSSSSASSASKRLKVMAPPANEVATDGTTSTLAANGSVSGDSQRPANVGILALEMYFPKTYVSQAALGKF